MKICVLNGSPKGAYSITLQTVLYLRGRYPDCDFEILNVGQKIRALEKDRAEAVEKLRGAELLLFAYPVYTFIAPYQLHRFIEMLKEDKVDLTGKFATQLTTSKHFYDVTAHRYVEQNCADLGLHYLGGLSADMDDLLTEKGRREARGFWDYILFAAKNGLYKRIPVVAEQTESAYTPCLPAVEKRSGNETVIVTNCIPQDSALQGKIADFQAAYPYPTRVINIADYPFAGGCLGCFRCAADGTCVYKDKFDSFLREEIQTAKAIVYAFTVKDHSMGASFKRYDDRQFCNGHRTVTMGMPVGYLVCGDYENETNLQMIVEGRSEVGGNFLAGVATDADGIRDMAKTLAYALENKLELPPTFYAVGGTKIFRDLIYLMQGLMKADHKFYKKHGIYDFPQKQRGTLLKMKLVGGLVSNPKILSKMGNKMNEGMILPYQKVLNNDK